MKKYTPQGILLGFLIILSIPSISFATGIFQLHEFKDSFKVVKNQRYFGIIYFLYSGDSTPSVGIIGDKILPEMKLSTTSNNGLYSTEYSWTPAVAGNYPLTLILTDNKGAILSQPFNFKVEEHSEAILTDSIPDGVVGNPYSAKIKIDFIGRSNSSTHNTYVVPNFYLMGENSSIYSPNVPEGMKVRFISNTWLGDNLGTMMIELYGIPTKIGSFPIYIGTSEGSTNYIDNYLKGLNTGKSYILTINDKDILPVVKDDVIQPATPSNVSQKITIKPTLEKINEPLIKKPIKTKLVEANNLATPSTTIPTSTNPILEKNIPKQPILSDILKDLIRYFFNLLHL